MAVTNKQLLAALDEQGGKLDDLVLEVGVMKSIQERCPMYTEKGRERFYKKVASNNNNPVPSTDKRFWAAIIGLITIVSSLTGIVLLLVQGIFS